MDYEGDTFVVRNIEKNSAVEHVIPSGQMSLALKGQSRSKKALARLAKLIGFYDNDHLRMINKGGIDCIYNFKTKPGKVVSAAGIDNFVVNDFDFKHAIFNPTVYDPRDTLERLVAIMDQTKVLQY